MQVDANTWAEYLDRINSLFVLLWRLLLEWFKDQDRNQCTEIDSCVFDVSLGDTTYKHSSNKCNSNYNLYHKLVLVNFRACKNAEVVKVDRDAEQNNTSN